MNTKNSKGTSRAFSTATTKKNRHKKNWDDKRIEIAGEFKNFRSARGIQNYSTMIDTRPTFDKSTKRPINFNLFRCKKDYRYKYTHKFPKLEVQRELFDSKTKDIRKFELLSNITEYTENQKLKLHIEFGSQSKFYHSEKVTSHS